MNATVELSLSEAITLIDIFREDGRFSALTDDLTEALATLVADGFTITADLTDDEVDWLDEDALEGDDLDEDAPRGAQPGDRPDEPAPLA